MSATTPMPGRGERRAGQRAGEERDRGERHEREPLEDGRGREPGDGECLEQDERVEPRRRRRRARPRPPACRRSPRASRRGTRRGRPASVRISAAVPRSFSVATEPIASRIATRTPNWLTFLASWSTASAVGRRRQDDRELRRRRRASRISGVNRARSGELRPTSRKTAATTGRRSVRHCSSSSLRRRTRNAGHRRPDLARPDEAAPVELVRRRRPDELEEHVLEGRPGPLERDEDDARGDDDREDLAGGRGGVRDGHPDRARRRRAAPVAHGAARRLVARPVDRVVLARRRHELGRSAGRGPRAGRRAGPPSRAGRDRGSRRGRRSARRRRGRGSRRSTVAVAAEPLDQLEQVPPALRVERAHRLVEDQQIAARG